MAKLFAGWGYRVLAFALLLPYSIDYAISGATRERMLRSVTELRDAWPLALYTMFSIAAVSVGLLALLFGVHWLSPKVRKRVAIAMVLYWFPHTLLIGHWCLFDDPSAWVP